MLRIAEFPPILIQDAAAPHTRMLCYNFLTSYIAARRVSGRPPGALDTKGYREVIHYELLVPQQSKFTNFSLRVQGRPSQSSINVFLCYCSHMYAFPPICGPS